MKIKSVKSVGKKPVYDISVADAEHYSLENGVVTHNTGIMYSANTVFFIGKRQVKDGKDLKGYEFVLKAEKSRTVKEKSEFPITVNFDGGIDPFSGMLELAQDIGFVVKPKVGWYSRAYLDEDTGEMISEEQKFREKATDNVEFWKPLFKHQPFQDAIKNRYQLGAMKSSKEIDDEVESLIGMKTEKHKFEKTEPTRAAVLEDFSEEDEDEE